MSRFLVQYACGHELDTARSRFPTAGPAETFIVVPGSCPNCDQRADSELTGRHEAEIAAMRSRHAAAALALQQHQRAEEAALKQRHVFELVSMWAHQGRELSPWALSVLKAGPGPVLPGVHKQTPRPGDSGVGPASATNGRARGSA